MSITDELRKEARGFGRYVYTAPQADCLTAIADRIDAEHERELRETGEDIVRDVRREWVRLPLDADGVPICVGDKVTEHEDGHTFKVDGFMDWDGEWWVFMRDGIQAPASRCTHHHEPTVEDVLREFAEKVIDSQIPSVHPTYEEAIAEFAAKLRLAKEGE